MIRLKSKAECLHHWSYNKAHWKDVIELTRKQHYTAHRYMVYDPERMMYRTTNGVLLDTRQAHELYIAEVLVLDAKE